MMAAIGSGEVFSIGRRFHCLARVGAQISTGECTILGEIAKRGNRYLRVLFVPAVVLTELERYGLKPWINRQEALAPQVLATHFPCSGPSQGVACKRWSKGTASRHEQRN
jgi:transposase